MALQPRTRKETVAIFLSLAPNLHVPFLREDIPSWWRALGRSLPWKETTIR